MDLVFIKLFILVAVIEFFIFIFYWSSVKKVLEYMKINEPAKWQALGKPTWFSVAFYRWSSLRFMKFVLKETDFGDEKLVQLKKQARLMLFLHFALMVTAFLVALAIIFESILSNS